MSKVQIAFFSAYSYEIEIFERENKKHGFAIQFYREHLSEQTAHLAQGKEAVCCFVKDNLSQKIIERLYREKVQLIALRATGFDHVDIAAAKGKLKIVNVPAYSPQSIAEHAIALMLMLLRKIPLSYLRGRENNFSLDGLLGTTLYGKTVGLIGMGNIGRATAKILNGFQTSLLVYDIVCDPALEKELAFSYVDLKTLFNSCDILSLHCPLSDKTHYLIDEQAIASMRDGVILINTARGAIVKTAALIQGLKSKKIGGAGLDVYEREQSLFFEDLSGTQLYDQEFSTLRSFPNVVITPHQAFFTKEALEQIAQITLHNIAQFSQGIALSNEVIAY